MLADSTSRNVVMSSYGGGSCNNENCHKCLIVGHIWLGSKLRESSRGYSNSTYPCPFEYWVELMNHLLLRRPKFRLSSWFRVEGPGFGLRRFKVFKSKNTGIQDILRNWTISIFWLRTGLSEVGTNCEMSRNVYDFPKKRLLNICTYFLRVESNWPETWTIII